ncbi:uncharacterized protein LOC130802421 isoform X1 [Amaranthus tricolor]|uniref:uncharacterized protein LOC130802421 isoform X1 n=1 Tax=Amaranthus tricolor TaxID=29722 RepID=UPI00258EA7EE|nr:uncharacterized protein LOC130802421 isoform X1 [Amaranthus tricolor]
MQNERHKQPSDPFHKFGGFGHFGGFGASIFGRNPFDDPFFTRPFGSMFRSDNFLNESPLVVPPVGPVIEELDTDDEKEEEENKETNGEQVLKSARQANEPFVDHPDDETDENTKKLNHRTDYNRIKGTQTQNFKVHSSKVTYGGVDGIYYSSLATRRMGSDGMILEDCKEADKRTGEAAHRISRGIHDKGHTLTRKLNSDGEVDMLQTLHNLNHDELGSFEEAWIGNGGKDLPTGTEIGSSCNMSNWGGFLLPPFSHAGNDQGSRQGYVDPFGGRTKKVVRIPIE